LACGKFDGSNSNTWYLDIEASNYMCGMKEVFFYLDENYTDNIALEIFHKDLLKEEAEF
jgi:hypothetical protein